MARQLEMNETLIAYLRSVSPPEGDVLADLREQTADMPGGVTMQVMPEQARFLALLARTLGARRVLEIGTYTGYSTLSLAAALPEGGRVVTCDHQRKWVQFARTFWERAGVAGRIEAVVGDARATLAAMVAAGAEPFDLAFIDADKAGYPEYYAHCVDLVRLGGLIVLDNTLFLGRVADPETDDADTVGIREVNARIRRDGRVEFCVLPFSDGVTVVRRREP